MKMRNIPGVCLMAAVLMLISSCSLPRSVRYFTSAVWSETGDEVAYIDLEYREMEVVLSSTSHKWNEQFTVNIADSDGQYLRQWGEEFQGWPVEIYYLKEQGYILLNWYDAKGEYVSILYEDGSSRMVVPEARLGTEDLIRAYPSPDGSSVAVVWAEIQCSSGEFGTDCSYEDAYGNSFDDPSWNPPHRARLQFLAPSDLTVLETFSRQFDSYLDFRWAANTPDAFGITDGLEKESGSYEYVLFHSDGSESVHEDSWGTFSSYPPTASAAQNALHIRVEGVNTRLEFSRVPADEHAAFADHRF